MSQGMYNLLAKLMGRGRRNLGNIPVAPPTRKELKAARPPRYKAAASHGYRGLPKSYNRPGAIAAPTLDQVRAREIKYGQRIIVQNGLMFFKADGVMWTKAEAERRAS